MEMEANMRARQQLHDYVKHTAVVNPHARIELREPNDHFKYERATDRCPAETEEIRPHPHGVELGTLIKMLDATDSYSVSGFMQGEFTRVGQKTAEDVIDGLKDRHYGRELAWEPPEEKHERDYVAFLEQAVSNKGADATSQFATNVAGVVTNRERLSHQDVVEIVDNVADGVEDDYDVTFGSTVRENAVDAVWGLPAGTVEERTKTRPPGPRRRGPLSDHRRSHHESRKDDAGIKGLVDRIAAKLVREDGHRDRFTHDELAEFVRKSAEDTEEYDDVTFGETGWENVLERLWAIGRTVTDDAPDVAEIAGDRDTASDLLEAMREADIIAPPTDCLAPITDELVEAGLKKEFDADFYAASTRDASVHGGDPFIVEAGPGLRRGRRSGEQGDGDAIRQPRPARLPARRLCDDGRRQTDQLAQLRAGPARRQRYSERPGRHHGPRRVDERPLHERVQGRRRERPRDGIGDRNSPSAKRHGTSSPT